MVVFLCGCDQQEEEQGREGGQGWEGGSFKADGVCVCMTFYSVKKGFVHPREHRQGCSDSASLTRAKITFPRPFLCRLQQGLAYRCYPSRNKCVAAHAYTSMTMSML